MHDIAIQETSKPSTYNDQRYREITELIADDTYSFQVTADGVLVREWGLDIFRTITGYAPDEFDANMWHVLIHPEDVHSMEQRVDAFRTGQSIVSEYRVVTKEGEVRWIRDHGRAVLDETGHMVRIYGAVQDITREKASEKQLARYQESLHRQVAERTHQLEQSEENLRALLNAIQEAALLMKPDGTVLHVNETAAHRLGTTVADMIGTNAFERISPELVQLRRAYMQQVVETGAPVRFDDVRDNYYVKNTIYPIHDSSGNVSRVAIFALDLTEQKHAEHQIRSLNAMLARRAEELASMNEELEAFSYSVAHDLRSPLWTIDLAAEMILDEYERCLEDNGQRFLERIRVNAQRMKHIVDALLTLARVTRRTKQDEHVNLSKLAHDSVAELRQKEPDRQVQVTIEEGLTAQCDPRLVSILLDNLLSNAWKFTQKRADAVIEMGHAKRNGNDPAGAIFFIRDNGVGFDSTQAHRLFRTFQRLHDTGEFAGTGIGLATVRRIVERHGGHIWAESAVGTGTTLYFTLEPGTYADTSESAQQLQTVQELIQRLEDDLVERSRLHPEQEVLRLLVDSVLALQQTPDGIDFERKVDDDASVDTHVISLLVHELNTPLQTIMLLLDLLIESGEHERSLLVGRVRHQVEHIGHMMQTLQEKYL